MALPMTEEFNKSVLAVFDAFEALATTVEKGLHGSGNVFKTEQGTFAVSWEKNSKARITFSTPTGMGVQYERSPDTNEPMALFFAGAKGTVGTMVRTGKDDFTKPGVTDELMLFVCQNAPGSVDAANKATLKVKELIPQLVENSMSRQSTMGKIQSMENGRQSADILTPNEQTHLMLSCAQVLSSLFGEVAGIKQQDAMKAAIEETLKGIKAERPSAVTLTVEEKKQLATKIAEGFVGPNIIISLKIQAKVRAEIGEALKGIQEARVRRNQMRP